MKELEQALPDTWSWSKTLSNPWWVSIYHRWFWCHPLGQRSEGTRIPRHREIIDTIQREFYGRTDPLRESHEYQRSEQVSLNILRPPIQEGAKWSPLGNIHQQKTDHRCHGNFQSNQTVVVSLLVRASSKWSPRWQEGKLQICTNRNREITSMKRKILALRK